MPHVTKTPYTVDVYDLMHRPGEMREKAVEVVVPEGFGNAVIGVKTGAQLHVDLRMESLHDGILVSAEVDGTVEGECVRCLIDVAEPVRVEFQELFAYSHDDAFDYEVHEDTIDLEPVIRDAVVLSLPFQPVCQEDCTGLCPQCGARLLDNPGHQHEVPIDPRWAALGDLAGLTGTDDGITASSDTDTDTEESY